ncbi:MAG: type II toxin-antitoxin system YafQ family toxin [Fibromonadaceae bacterium]|jgi:mRNA interferase YafQ|nr:type II toxin-antitoxin system YafQ family toxin [Fibromonadaceae bacterium]
MKNLSIDPEYEKCIKRLKKKHYNIELLKEPIRLLVGNIPLPQKYHDHALSGNLKGNRELHIEPNWLLMYKSTDTEIILIRTGSHDDLYK